MEVLVWAHRKKGGYNPNQRPYVETQDYRDILNVPEECCISENILAIELYTLMLWWKQIRLKNIRRQKWSLSNPLQMVLKQDIPWNSKTNYTDKWSD